MFSHCYFRLCNSMDCSMPASPVIHCLLEFAQTHVHWGEGNGNPLQYSCLENPMDRGACWAAVHGVAQGWTWLKRLNMHAYIGEGNGNPLQYSCLENPRGGLRSVGSDRVWYDWSDLAAAAAVCPLSQGCYWIISSSVVPFFPCLQSFPTSESFQISLLFASGSQSIGASVSFLPINIQG